MFRHYRVILRELVISNLPSYTSISNAAVGNAIYSSDVQHCIKPTSNILIINCNTDSCICNNCVTWQVIDYKHPEDDTIVYTITLCNFVVPMRSVR